MENGTYLGHQFAEFDDAHLDTVSWRGICLRIRYKNIVHLQHSYDYFIIRCSEDFESAAAALNARLRIQALVLATDWGYEFPEFRANRCARLLNSNE